MSRLTRRGWGTIVIVVVAVALAARFGARSLNAVVLPLLLAVVAALVATHRADRPEVERAPPDDGFAGESHAVELLFEMDAPSVGVVRDAVGEGLTATGNDVKRTIGSDDPVSYDVTYERRGIHELGPLTVTVRDVLGLAEQTFEYRKTDSVLVYPKVYDLPGASGYELALLSGSAFDRDREEFDRLREYQSGDTLRDVHWRTSAKRASDDLVVKEFVADDDMGEVLVAGSADPAGADAMASAVASLAVHLLSVGIKVGVAVPDGRIDPDAGADHRTDILELLARTGPGEAQTHEMESADVSVVGSVDRTTVEVDGRTTTFSALAGFSLAEGNGHATGDAAGEPDAVQITSEVPS